MKKNSRFINIVCLFILVQPLFDASIYLLREYLKFESIITSLVRPACACLFFFCLLFSNKINKKNKIFGFLYLVLYGFFCIGHIVNINNYFVDNSLKKDEFRYLFNCGYYIMQLINMIWIFKIASENEKKSIIKCVCYALFLVCFLYGLSILTGTSGLTYPKSATKNGYKGWSVSVHYVGHVLTYGLPIVLYAVYEKKLFKYWYKYLFVYAQIIICFYLVGTKTPFFGVFVILTFYTILYLIKIITKKEKFNFDFCSLVLILTLMGSTYKLTMGYANLHNQIDVYNQDLSNSNLTIDSFTGDSSTKPENPGVQEKPNNPEITDKPGIEEPESPSKKPYIPNEFEERLLRAEKLSEKIDYAMFDNRTVQIKYNSNLRSISPISDKIFGYGYFTMSNRMWVETDTIGIFYSFGLIGFLLIILLPSLYFGLNGLYCLIDIKNMNCSKWLFGFSLAISFGIITFVGYTILFSQTVFYMIMILVLCKEEFSKVNYKGKRKYLFMINDLNVGGAEVGLVDTINELSKTDSVDLVLLRKEGLLLERLNSNVNVYSILDDKYSNLKKKLYHVMYFMGGIFTRYVYSHTINYEYEAEISYLEGYPAVFIASSTNPNSIKVASIRVGLKKHKLSADKIPFSKYVVNSAYGKMDNIYTVSEETTKEFIEKYPKYKDKTQTIYTYFNKEYINEKANEPTDFEFDKNSVNFLAIGKFRPQKSYDRLVLAFERLHKKNSKVKLYIIGDYATSEGEKIQNLIIEKKLEKDIILCGIKNNPYSYIKKCDALVSSSLYEGYPRVVNEALCLKKICIGTNVTGTKEALYDGKGILVEDSVDGLYEGMLKVVDDPNIYKQYKEKLDNYDGNKKEFFDKFINICNPKKEMLIYIPKLSYGGMEKALVNLINYANLNDKYNVSLYMLYNDELNYINLLPSNMKVYVAWNKKWNILGRVVSAIKLELRYIHHFVNKYDIAISYSYQHPIFLSLTRVASDNNIVFIHSNLAEAVDEKKIRKYKKCKYTKFKKIVCVSHNAKNAFIKLFNREENVFVINNLIDGDVILEKANEEVDDFKFSKDKIYFVNVCRHFDLYKRLNRIINATKKLNDEGYKFDVLFVGDGPDHQMYIDEVKNKNIKNIHIIGKRSNPYKYIKNSSAFILSSIREGYPVVFVESMVLNKPIITTNVSDAKEDIEGKFGYVVDNDDEAIYFGMKKYLDKSYKIKKSFDYQKFNSDIKEKLMNILDN